MSFHNDFNLTYPISECVFLVMWISEIPKSFNFKYFTIIYVLKNNFSFDCVRLWIMFPYFQERSRSPVPVSVSHRKTTISPPPGHRVVHPHRPTSARASPRRSGSRSDSRPQSAHPQNSRVDNVEESSHTTPVPDESAEQQPIEVPIQGDA